MMSNLILHHDYGGEWNQTKENSSVNSFYDWLLG